MDLHPRERVQSYAPHHGPGLGHVPSHMKMDTPRPPVNYESFPCNGSYGCPYPFPYHGCYYNQIPDYHGQGGLHYPHYAPPPNVYCNGIHPPFPGGYPFQYLPSPHYSVADRRFEFDKKGPADYHCCGCPNHSCQQKENKNVKIEEQTSDDERDNVASFVPPELKNQPYPVLWIPPGYNRKEEGEQIVKPESKKVSSFDNEAEGNLKPFAQEPGVWNGWLPVDPNNLNSLVQGRDEKGIAHQQNGDSKSSCPVGCVPRYPEQKDKLELNDRDQKPIWDPSHYRIFPLKLIKNQDNKSMPDADVKKIENSSSEDGPKAGDKNVVKKIIPVKQMDQSEEKVLSKNNQTEQKREPEVEKNQNIMPLKLKDKEGEREHLENNRNVQSSLSKASKLPPVCLRVDPLPSRRTKGGSSRSPSPSANKTKSEILSHNKSSSSSTTQGNNQHNMQSSADSDLSRLQSGKKVKDIEVVDSTLRDNKVETQKEDLSQSLVNASPGDSQERVSSGCQDEKGVKSDQEFFIDGVKNVDKLSGEIMQEDKLAIEAQSGDVLCESGTGGGPIHTNKLEQASSNGAPNHKFLEAEAAVIIQSAYRGFEVRRWEPLKKLKEIARIEGEMKKVRLDVQSLVPSGSGNINKQKIVIGETIMNLLLQLDTLQGLHPSIRNIRKSVAKGLVSLQEQLDSITSQNPEELKESDVSKHSGEIFKRAVEEERQAGEDRHEHNKPSPSHMDVSPSTVDVEKSELLSGTDEMCRAPDEIQQDSSGYVDPNGQHLEPLLEVKEQSDLHGVCEDHDSFLVESKELPPLVIAEEKLNPVQLQNLSSLVESDCSSKEDEVSKVNTEVPPRVSDPNSNAQVAGDGFQIGGRCIVEPGKHELVQESGLISLGNEANETSAEEQQHTKLLAESLKSDLKDNNAPELCSVKSESFSELKDNVGAGGNSERDKEFSGDDMLGTELVEASNETRGNNTEGESNVCVVDGDGKMIDDRRTAAVGVGTLEMSTDMKEVANAFEVEAEGDDMHGVEFETKEKPDINETGNVCEVEGDDKPVDDMHKADMVGLEQSETPEVEEFGKDVGAVEDTRSIGTRGPESEDQSKKTLDIQVKQQKPSFMSAECGEEVHMEEIANCNSEQKMAVGEYQEMWEDKFDNKEIHENQGNGNIIYLSREEDPVEEDLDIEKVKKQPQKEFSAGEELKESDKGVLQENEILKETVEKLIAAGKEQLNAISSLSERVKDLEKKLSRKKNLKLRRARQKAPSPYILQV
ncbi:hypothetical protein AgCh_019100 [Apium graveolens]